MRVVAMSYVLVAAAVLAGAAAAQNNPPSPSGSSGAPTTGQTDSTAGQAGGVREAPVGHRQPRVKDLPSGRNETPPIRSPEEQDVDRKLRICRDC